MKQFQSPGSDANEDPTRYSGIQRLRNLLVMISQMPNCNLKVTPLTEDQLTHLDKRLPPDQLELLKQIGEIDIGGGCLLLDTFIPRRVADDPNRLFEMDENKEAEHFLIYARDGHGDCFGYDTRTLPYESYRWDFCAFHPEKTEEAGALQLIENIVAVLLEWLGRLP
jgi:hypothetical protein